MIMRPLSGVQLHALAAVSRLAQESSASVIAAEVGIWTGQSADAAANTLRSLVARELLTVSSGRRDAAVYALTVRGGHVLAVNRGSLERTDDTRSTRGRKPRQAVAVAQFLAAHPGQYWTIRQLTECTGAGREAARQAVRGMVAAGEADIDDSRWPSAYRLHDDSDGRHLQKFTTGPDGLISCASCQAAITYGIMLHERGCDVFAVKPNRVRRPRRTP